MTRASTRRKVGVGHRGSVRVLPPVMVALDDEHRAEAIRCLTEMLLAAMSAALRREEMSPSLGTLSVKRTQEGDSA